MAFARYYIWTGSSPLPERLLFIVARASVWIWGAVRGVDAQGRALALNPRVQQGGGTFDLKGNCVYELVFLDEEITADVLTKLRASNQRFRADIGISLSPYNNSPGVQYSKDDHDPPPPPPPDVPFDKDNNVFRIK